MHSYSQPFIIMTAIPLGAVFATSITLSLVPAHYLIPDDGPRMLRGERKPAAAVAASRAVGRGVSRTIPNRSYE